MAISLDGANGITTPSITSANAISLPSGSASTPALAPSDDTNTGIFFPAADTIAFAEGGAEAMRITSDGNAVLGNTTAQPFRLNVVRGSGMGSYPTWETTTARNIALFETDNGEGFIVLGSPTNGVAGLVFADPDSKSPGSIVYSHSENSLRFNVSSAERARIINNGSLVVGTTATPGADITAQGMYYLATNGFLYVASTDGNPVAAFNRNTSDGTIVEFKQAATIEGTISVSGTTVSYNGGHLSRWAQMLTKPDLLKGTVMSNLDEMNVYIAPTTYWTEEDELPEGVNVGDVKVETHEVENEQLNKVKVSDVEGDANVAGVFVNWTYDEAHQVDEINMAMTGDMIIRIAQGVTVARGDLLMSAGDGTAKPQGDDIVRSKTIAKVTSTHVTCTYDDGSYCVPCVLMAC
jgi:hypothetical protein